MQIVLMCVQRAGGEREAASGGETEKMTDMAGGKEKSERQPLRDCMVNPLPHLSTPPPSLCALPWLPDRAPNAAS